MRAAESRWQRKGEGQERVGAQVGCKEDMLSEFSLGGARGVGLLPAAAAREGGRVGAGGGRGLPGPASPLDGSPRRLLSMAPHGR